MKWIGRGEVEELMYTLANLLALEEHYAELGMSDEAIYTRSIRVKTIREYVKSRFNVDVEGTALASTWCIIKHLLLSSYHAYELYLMGRGSPDILLEVHRNMLKRAIDLFIEWVKEPRGGRSGLEEEKEEEEEP